MQEPVTTVVGNLGSDPELRFTQSGAAVANFSVGSTPRVKDGTEWVDGETLWLRVSIWRQAAENAAESFHRGDRVIVTGRLKQRSWDDKDSGQKRTVIEMEADEIGASVQFATVTVNRGQRNSAPRTDDREQGSRGRTGSSAQRPAQDDPWAAAPPARPATSGQSRSGVRGGDYTEPPF